MKPPGDTVLTVVVCLAEVLTMVGSFAFATVLPTLFGEWGLSATEAGWISGAYFAGYTVAVPVLMSLTDRMDARRVYRVAAAVTAMAWAGFAAAADGVAGALLCQLAAGAGLGGTYMPGLRVLVDRYRGQRRSRVLSFYTASFSLGTAGSVFLAGVMAETFGWRSAFVLAAGGAALAAGLVALLPAKVPESTQADGRLLDFRPVFANRQAMGYVIGYGIHTFELFGLRSWLVAFLAFVLARGDGGGGWPSPSAVASLGALLAVLGSIGGQEMSAAFGRRRVIAAAMLVSGALACGFGFSAGLPYGGVVGLALLYCMLAQVDSAALTAGAVEEAEAGRQGATLAVHSVIGFTGASAGPLVMGVILDAGGQDTPLAWGLAFAALGVAQFLGPPMLLWSARKR